MTQAAGFIHIHTVKVAASNSQISQNDSLLILPDVYDIPLLLCETLQKKEDCHLSDMYLLDYNQMLMSAIFYKHVALICYKMPTRTHTETILHNNTQNRVLPVPYIGMMSGNVLWCCAVYAREGLTHNGL